MPLSVYSLQSQHSALNIWQKTPYDYTGEANGNKAHTTSTVHRQWRTAAAIGNDDGEIDNSQPNVDNGQKTCRMCGTEQILEDRIVVLERHQSETGAPF